MYEPTADTSFAGSTRMKLIVEPHDFSLAINGQVLRSSSCSGYAVEVTCDGGAVFFDSDRREIACVEAGNQSYKKVKLQWQQDSLTLLFGFLDEVDYYPNCDGESDRWGHEWVTQRTVTLNLPDHSITIR